jgi:hypothetical protein
MTLAKISFGERGSPRHHQLGSLGPTSAYGKERVDYKGMVELGETFGVGPLSSWQSLCN